MALPYDPEYFKAIEPLLPQMSQMKRPEVHDIETRRANLEVTLGPALRSIPKPPNVELKTYHTEAKGGYSVPIIRYSTNDSTKEGPLPAILYIHGGGYFAFDVATLSNVIASYAAASDVQLFAVDYRLAPEAPFPAPIEDCYASLLWLHEHAAEFNVDPARIAVYGESAGGGLAASLAIMARDRQLSPPLAKQVLIYPMLNDRNLGPSPLEQFLIWSSDDNITGWTAYLGDSVGKEDVSPYAAAARVASLEGLPRAYIDVGFIDLFRDDCLSYASRLAAANIEVEFHLYPGVPHAWEFFAKGTNMLERAMANRTRAMNSF